MLALTLILGAVAAGDACLDCHRDSKSIALASGESLSLSIDAAALAKSAHKKLACTDCHADLAGTQGAHVARPPQNRREMAIASSEACKKCHFANYKDTLDSVHRAKIAAGRLEGAVCSDCHGAHDVSSPGDPRTKISQTCSTCHKAIADAFVKSVHGASLASGSEDAPTCTDCHKSHAIADARAGAFQLKTHELCGNCHTNEKLMAKYKLSTAVLQTYLQDFHGTTVKLQQGDPKAKPVVALCTDCHGVHDIAKVRDANSPVLKANLLATCQKCHPDAKANFPSSWLSHYQPSFQKAPLVYLVKLLYMVLIPFMIGGLGLQVVLHLWRIVVNR